ncbi:hypothetical protein AKJ47_00930 [candidate division MSBL1 archaeon SCGC-AAA261G05]|uniref:(5-formylfuran-3-yl)methyl phosphate synthase n=1 Tax=candidate division MSBL1 archaeon SCGC-AAA261G05 TaxID=1698276 RepID=A0A133VC67_9EURY|nr:hypothetical protein AKJ47_00930 [candidate division MSBL1 archaeon SCGC-AAA261G05]
MTLFLVSPISSSEALAAYRGGADIVDVKNPEEGALGASFPWIITEVRQALPEDLPLSASIGDAPDLPGTVTLAALGALNAGANIIKVGLKGPSEKDRAINLMQNVVRAIKKVSDSAEIVACGYGDYQRVGAIKPLLIPEIAHESGADTAMLDTAIKDGKPLTHFLSINKLSEFIEKTHSLNLQAALAGSLGQKEISELKFLKPDVIGVRSAVCTNGDRKQGKITEAAVREVKKVLED